MKHLVFILFLISTLNLNAQDFDLIVTTTGDSIACNIDSITNSTIYFEMKVKGNWFHTFTNLEEVLIYKFDEINPEQVIFKPETSYIVEIKQPSDLDRKKLRANYYDLIVTQQGDSIACYIDSINSTHIFFEMKKNNSWFHTNSTLNNIAKFEYLTINKKLAVFKTSSSYIDKIKQPKNINDKALYTSRYLFAPSAYPMAKGMRSYSIIDIFIYDFQFGLSDRFSLSTGTSIVLNPVYIIPTYSFKINEKSAIAIGDLFLFTTYDHFEYGNLLYAMYSRGNCNNNFTIGAGLWISKIGEDQTETIDPVMDPSFIVYNKEIKTTSPAFNFSAQVKLAPKAYFITENYWFKINLNANADLKGPNPSGAWYDITIRSEDYAMEETILAGIIGFRFISKKNPLRSWQISSIYVFAHHGSIPDKYKQPDWETYNNENGYSFFPIPYISYTKKF